MKTCPVCGELLGDSVVSCFKCHYDYELKRVIPSEERQALRLERERVAENQHQERLIADVAARAAEEEKRALMEQRIEERQQALMKKPPDILLLNDTYEYDVVSLHDHYNGMPNIHRMKKILNDYAKDGWKLVTMISNELGVNSTSVGVGNISIGTNTTMDSVVMVFERRIYTINK